MWTLKYQCEYSTVHFICILPTSHYLSACRGRPINIITLGIKQALLQSWIFSGWVTTSLFKRLNFRRVPSTQGRWTRIFPTYLKKKTNHPKVVSRVVFCQSHQTQYAAINYASCWKQLSLHNLIQKHCSASNMKCFQARFTTPEAATTKNKSKSDKVAPQKHYRLNLLSLIFKPAVNGWKNLNSICNTQQLSATRRIFFVELQWMHHLTFHN